MKNHYQIAGLVVAMECSGRTEQQSEKYKCEYQNAIDVDIVPDLERCRQVFPKIPLDGCVYLATGKSFYKQLLNFDGFMLHSSAVVKDGRAYLFSADCGTGKTTHTGLWLKAFPDAYILNDDKPALRRIDGTWYAFGTPWSGKHDISVNTGVPVAGIALVERGETNRIQRCAAKDAILDIYKQTNRVTGTAEFRMKLLELLDQLLTEVPIWKLHCNMDEEAAHVSYNAMSQYEKEESL